VSLQNHLPSVTHFVDPTVVVTTLALGSIHASSPRAFLASIACSEHLGNPALPPPHSRVVHMHMKMQEMPQVAVVTVSAKGVKVQPEHLRVKVGGDVTWRMAVSELLPPLRATFYFRGPSPFDWTTRELDVAASTGAIALSQRAATSGDYKYGVRVVEASSGREIGDDDPYLHVTDR
jgi:hypothetical protein